MKYFSWIIFLNHSQGGFVVSCRWSVVGGQLSVVGYFLLPIPYSLFPIPYCLTGEHSLLSSSVSRF
jgi:hypothetical protein